MKAGKVKVFVFILPDEACMSVRILCLSVWCIACCGDICLLRIVFLRVLWVGLRKMEVSEGGFDKMIGGEWEESGVWRGKINDRRDAGKLNKNKSLVSR